MIQFFDNLQLSVKGKVNIGEYLKRGCRGEYSPMSTEPEATNCFSIIFRGEYKWLQNNGLKHINTDTIVSAHIRKCSRSFYNKLTGTSIFPINWHIEFGSKTNERNTTKNIFIPYLCFIAVDFIHSCHDRLKMSNSSLKKKTNSVNRSGLLGIDATTEFTILKSLEYEFLKWVLFQARQQSFWKFSILSNIQGRVVRKPVNVNPGLNINWSIRFSLLKMLFTSNIWCSMRFLQLKTEEQIIQTDYPTKKLQNWNQNSR